MRALVTSKEKFARISGTVYNLLIQNSLLDVRQTEAARQRVAHAKDIVAATHFTPDKERIRSELQVVIGANMYSSPYSCQFRCRSH